MILIYLFIAALMGIGIYSTIMKDNMIKKVIGLGIMSHAVHLFIISMGYRAEGIAPIMTNENMLSFSALAVDPLPQALVLTSIVIDFGITVLALAIVVMLYKHFDTLSSKLAGRMKG
ncbi:MAG: cation:proton antiporter subunit C [Candidatus Micrarchaeota archaeon]|nr:cation:proton antiporter subunit C [Candidatus Micrarchaeota archaeon]